MPVLVYDLWGSKIEKRILLPYKQNTTHIEYRYIEGSGAIRLGLRPGMHLRNHDAPVNSEACDQYRLSACDFRLELSGGPDLPVLRLKTTPQTSFTYDPKTVNLDYLMEKSRGYPWQGCLWSPGYYRTDLTPGSSIVFTASTENWDVINALPYPEVVTAELTRLRTLMARVAPEGDCGILPELVLAADQFLITPVGRTEDAARAHASGTSFSR